MEPIYRVPLSDTDLSATRININVPKIERIRVSDHGPWLATYSRDGTLAAWEVTADPVTGRFNDVQFRWFHTSEPGCFATITISPDGNYMAGYFDEEKDVIVYSRTTTIIRRKMDVDCIPTFLSSGQLALLTDHCLVLLKPPHFKEGHFYRIPQTDEFWRTYNQPLHRGIIYRSEPNNHLSLWSVTSGGGLIRYIRTGITEWACAGIAVSQTGTLVAFYCKTHITVLHAASGMLAASFEWPRLKYYDRNIFFDFVNGDRFLVGCFWAETNDSLYMQMWRWDMDNASLWVSDPVTRNNTNTVFAIFPREKGIIIESYTNDESHWRLRIMQNFEGVIKPVNSAPKDYIGDTQSNNSRAEALTTNHSPCEVEGNEKDDDYTQLDEKEVVLTKIRFDVQLIEPWENGRNEKIGMAYLLDRDNDDKIQLLVGRSTIQLWTTKSILPPTDNTPLEDLLHIWHVPKHCSFPTSTSPPRTPGTPTLGHSTPAQHASAIDILTIQQGANLTGQAQSQKPLDVEIVQLQDGPEIKFYIHEEALSVKVTYVDINGISESELYHLPLPDPRIKENNTHCPSHDAQFLIHAWHALVSCWVPMAPRRSIYTPKSQAVIECKRCKHAALRSIKKCIMSENGCLECLKAEKFCPAQDRYFVMDGIYKLITNGIELNWDVFARISGAIFYQPILKSNNRNLHEYLLLTELDQQLPSTLFCSSEMVAKPLLHVIETENTERIREFLKYMIKMIPICDNRTSLGFIYPITQSLLALNQRYPDFIITIMECLVYIQATSDPVRSLYENIMPSSAFRSNRPENSGFTATGLLINGTITSSFSYEKPCSAIVPLQISGSFRTKEERLNWNPFHRQRRPVTICLLPFMDFNSTFEYVYDKSVGMIVKKRSGKNLFAKLALSGSEFFGTPASEAILNFKWESGVKISWIVFFTLHILYYGLFCFSIPSYISWDSKSYGLRIALIVIYLALGLLFFMHELQQLVFNWHETSIFHSIWNYAMSIYNWVDVAAYVLPITAGFNTLITHQPWSNSASAFTILILWVHFLLQLRIFKQLGLYVIILLEIGKSIGWLLVIITVLIFAFAHAIFSLMYGNTSDDGMEAFVTFDRTLRTTWFFLSGDWTPADSYHDNRSLAILTILFSFLTVIVFINILIAVMSSIVEDTQKKADRIWLQVYAQIVAEMEVYWAWTLIWKKQYNKPDIVYYEASTKLVRKFERKRSKKESDETEFL